MIGINETGEIPQCLKDCHSDTDCDPRDRCTLRLGGGACLPKECPTRVDFGMLKRRELLKVDHQGSLEFEYTMICHSEYILRHRIREESYRSHVVECSFNVTGSNHVKWVFKDVKTASLSPNTRKVDVQAICENGLYYLAIHIYLLQ